MVVNFDKSVVNLRDKVSDVDRKKTQSDASQKSGSGSDSEKKFVADVIGIRNENQLAATSHQSIKSSEEAYDLLGDLKQQFAENSGDAMNAHKKANPDAVMQFYPFE